VERLFGSESRSCVQGINIRKFRGLLKPRKLKFNEIELSFFSRSDVRRSRSYARNINNPLRVI
jgi:hypothetical protein